MQSDEVLDTPVARRSDSTTFMVAQDSDRIPPQPNFTGTSPASHGRAFDAEASILSQVATVSTLALLQQCICAVGGPNTTLTDPAIEVALELLVQFLTTAQDEQLAPDECIAFVPASRYAAAVLLTAPHCMPFGQTVVCPNSQISRAQKRMFKMCATSHAF